MKKSLLIILLLFLSLSAYSHRLDSVIIDVHFKKDGTYQVSAYLHLPHILSLTEPFDFRKYNDQYEELIALPNDEFLALINKRKQFILNQFNFTFDGKKPDQKISFLLKDRKPIELLFVGHEKSYVVKEAYCQVIITGTYPKFTKILQWENNWKNKTHFIKIFMEGQLQASAQAAKEATDSNPAPEVNEDSYMATTFVQQNSSKEIDLTNLPTSQWDVFKEFTYQGFIHILPKGFDHILFVLCLFLSFIAWPSLFKQITAFTIAHSITLGLCVYELVSLPPSIIEPLIALSIVVVAIENYFKKEVGHSRLYIVFGFGLMHGLGFAGVIKEMQLPAGQRLNSLFSFNVGVELGQLTIIFIAWALIGAWFRKKEWYHIQFVKPASLAIATYAAYLLIIRLPSPFVIS